MKRNWDKLYNTYVRTYNKLAAKTKSVKGMEEIYTKTEFKDMYTSLEKDRMEEVRQNIRGKSLNVTQDLVAGQQAFDLSVKQAKNVRQAMIREGYLKEGEKVNLRDLRNGNPKYDDFWKMVKGIDRELVGTVIFGSE